MRIEVIDGGWATPQARAYAEYRLFTTLARHARVIRSVRVNLERSQRKDGAEEVLCAVHIGLEPSGSVRTRANGGQPHGAIDRAAERIGNLLNRRTPKAVQA